MAERYRLAYAVGSVGNVVYFSDYAQFPARIICADMASGGR
jgi:hypothetical protein